MSQLNIRRVLLGAPLHTAAAAHQRLNKIVALPVFSSDALSSVAYGPQMAMIGLVAAGSGAFHLTLPIMGSIVGLLIILTISYNQTIHAYPSGGGSYIVARDNLGVLPAEIAGVALLTDYTLTVAVSVSSGIDAILSAYPFLDHLTYRLGLNVCATLFIMLMNLRGVRESGAVFALPTYLFITSLLAMVGMGIWQISTGGLRHLPLAPSHVYPLTEGLSILLILRAFANGCTALTGVEAISNGIPAFRKPESRNASITMVWMAVILGTMLMGVAYLAQYMAGIHHLIPSDSGETVPSQIAHAVTGSGTFYYIIQWATFLILIIAANTSFADFPRLSAIAARDRHLPRWFGAVGDRLVFQNGIIVLAVLAIILELAFEGSTNALIPLYAIGVYMAFTLSQAGMVARWLRLRSRGWQWRMAVNGIGSFLTAVVVVVFAIVKFTSGAWVVLILMPILVWLLTRIDHHYQMVGERLKLSTYQDPGPAANTALLLVAYWDPATQAAAEYVRMAFSDARALHIRQAAIEDSDLDDAWSQYVPGIPLRVTHETRDWLLAIRAEMLRIRQDDPQRTFTVVLPRSLHPTRGNADRMAAWWLKWRLLHEPFVAVADASTLTLPETPEAVFPTPTTTPRTVSISRENGASTEATRVMALATPGASRFRCDLHTVLILVPGMHRGTVEALAYARQRGKDLRALHIEIEQDRTEELREHWEDYACGVPLIIIESAYRQLREPLVRYVQVTRQQQRTQVLTVILAEFVPRKWWAKALHNQSGLLLKFALRGQPNVVVINTRYFLE